MVDFQSLAQTVGINIGTGALIGGIIGFTAKKVAKLVAIIVGLELALFKILESRQILVVNRARVGASFLTAGEAAASQAPPSWIMTLLSTLSVSGGFAGGFLLGFKKA